MKSDEKALIILCILALFGIAFLTLVAFLFLRYLLHLVTSHVTITIT